MSSPYINNQQQHHHDAGANVGVGSTTTTTTTSASSAPSNNNILINNNSNNSNSNNSNNNNNLQGLSTSGSYKALHQQQQQLFSTHPSLLQQPPSYMIETSAIPFPSHKSLNLLNLSGGTTTSNNNSSNQSNNTTNTSGSGLFHQLQLSNSTFGTNNNSSSNIPFVLTSYGINSSSSHSNHHHHHANNSGASNSTNNMNVQQMINSAAGGGGGGPSSSSSSSNSGNNPSIYEDVPNTLSYSYDNIFNLNNLFSEPSKSIGEGLNILTNSGNNAIQNLINQNNNQNNSSSSNSIPETIGNQQNNNNVNNNSNNNNNNNGNGNPLLMITPSSDISSPSPPNSSILTSHISSSSPNQPSPLPSPSSSSYQHRPQQQQQQQYYQQPQQQSQHPLSPSTSSSSPLDFSMPTYPSTQSIPQNPNTVVNVTKKLKREFDQTLPKDEWEQYFPNGKIYSLFNSKNDLTGSFGFKVKRIDKNITYSDLDSAWILYRQNRFQIETELTGSLENHNSDPTNPLFINNSGAPLKVEALHFTLSSSGGGGSNGQSPTSSTTNLFQQQQSNNQQQQQQQQFAQPFSHPINNLASGASASASGTSTSTTSTSSTSTLKSSTSSMSSSSSNSSLTNETEPLNTTWLGNNNNNNSTSTTNNGNTSTNHILSSNPYFGNNSSSTTSTLTTSTTSTAATTTSVSDNQSGNIFQFLSSTQHNQLQQQVQQQQQGQQQQQTSNNFVTINHSQIQQAGNPFSNFPSNILPLQQQQQQTDVQNNNNNTNTSSSSSSQWLRNPLSDDIVYTNGKVGINTNSPTQALTVNGNILVTGDLYKPSDRRIKSNIVRDSSNHWDKIDRLKIYNYDRKKMPGYDNLAASATSSATMVKEKGFLAQELREVIPNAVSVAGEVRLQDGSTIPNLLVVNDRVLLLENIGATQQIGRTLRREHDHIIEMDKEINRVKLEGNRQQHVVLNKMQDLVTFMLSEEQSKQHNSDHGDSCVYCSLMGLGPAWTMFVFGFFVPLFWLFGSFFLFSPSRVKWVSGLVNFITLVIFVIATVLLVFYQPNIAAAIIMPSIIVFGIVLCIVIGFFRQRTWESKKRFLRERMKLMQKDGYRQLNDHIDQFRNQYSNGTVNSNSHSNSHSPTSTARKNAKKQSIDITPISEMQINHVDDHDSVSGTDTMSSSTSSVFTSEVDSFKSISLSNHLKLQEIPLQKLVMDYGKKKKQQQQKQQQQLVNSSNKSMGAKSKSASEIASEIMNATGRNPNLPRSQSSTVTTTSTTTTTTSTFPQEV
ncbi:NDT80/PhoG-like protein [Cavenderia fasciculata]|uniref:NDT80/PhoG-like protein n=1 Tax=Cavenderia fasciculata TaxID=261658 RepID=F4PNP3_CACFS|nr:NDT80/PhoG-like protein [Cavenderia fasciculata]EGG23096.1 NDT80/PhoG-like protein [Cavenderia fasciculata]|eukprot:XP_004360947.1 NDT80/PhoG-like protein [Cavenderia fasciculata]